MMYALLLKRAGFCLLLGLLLAGCGRKEVPQPVVSGAFEKPQLTGLQYGVNGSVFRIDFELRGDARGVGYQIDRTQVDPYCQCPGFWRRFYEEPARPGIVNRPLYKMITMKNTTVEYLFRMRAVDMQGNLGAWSPVMHARGVDLLKQ